MSTHDETICGAARNEGGLNSTKVEGHIRDLLDNLPLLVTLVILIRVKHIHLAEPRCKSLLRTHRETWRRASSEAPARK